MSEDGDNTFPSFPFKPIFPWFKQSFSVFGMFVYLWYYRASYRFIFSRLSSVVFQMILGANLLHLLKIGLCFVFVLSYVFVFYKFSFRWANVYIHYLESL